MRLSARLNSILLSACMGGAAVAPVLAVLVAPAALAATPDQQNAFLRAVQFDDPRTVRSLLTEGIDPNRVNPLSGEPALVVAVREGSMNVLQLLLANARIQVDAPAKNGNTALMMAAFKRNMAAAEALLAKGAAVNRVGWTPLHYAAASGDLEIGGLLLQRGAKVDPVSPKASGSYTPLMMAAREGQEDFAKFLIEHGANRRLKNGEGLTAAQIAERADHQSIAKLLSGAAR